MCRLAGRLSGFDVPVTRRQNDPHASRATGDREFFIPADTTDEAIERIFSLTGRSPSASRGEKRALLALRDALHLDVDVVELNSVLAERMAAALDIDWDEDRFSYRSTVSLAGLNALLEGASHAYQEGSLQQVRDQGPASLGGPEWSAFRPARKKIEAVTRIAALTDAPPESLGPGGKERKSVFANLAQALFPDLRIEKMTKTLLGRALADHLDVPWTDECYSTQQSVSLTGLNTILAGAERHLGLLGTSLADLLRTPLNEGDALAAALRDGLPDFWEGRQCITWMLNEGIRGWADNEWQGFYNEAMSKRVLARAYPPSHTPPRVKFGNTVFDYALNRVWDLKAHTERKVLRGGERVVPGVPSVILNDESAFRACVAEQGLGFLVLGGEANMDESGDFVAWHRGIKAGQGRRTALSNSRRSRDRKESFRPLHIESFWLENTMALDSAIAAGHLAVRPQGRQSPLSESVDGRPRNDKFMMNIRRSRQSSLQVARYNWRPLR